MSGDDFMRAQAEGMPVPHHADTPLTAPPALTGAKVAVVTSAGLMRPGDAPWVRRDHTFRVFERSERDLIVANTSANFDRTGAAADLNVVYPIDRLEEMAAEGVIGEVAPRHLSFMGATGGHEYETIHLDSGPAAAALLRADGVDVVLLTPV